jgi:O-antigen ligase
MNKFFLIFIVLSASLLGGYLSPLAGITSFFFLTVPLFFLVGPDIRLRKDEMASLLFGLCGVASVLYSADKWGAILFSGSFIAGSLFYVTLRNSSDWEDLLLKALVIGGCINGLIEALRQANLIPYTLFYNPNPFSGFLAPLVPVSLYLYAREKKKRYAVAAGLLVFANFISGSRTGVFTMVLALIAVLVFFWRGRQRSAIKALLLMFVVGFCSFLVFSEAKDFLMVKRIDGLTEKLPTGIIQREYILKVALEIIGQAPVLGHGLNSFTAVMSSLSNPYVVYPAVHAHSLYLNILAELGIVGLALFLLFLWFVVRGPLRRAFLVKIALFSFLFHNVVEYNFPAPPFQMLFYLLCAVIMQGKEPEPALLRLRGWAGRIVPSFVALYFLVVHVFPLVGLFLLGRADAAFQERDATKTLKYLFASTYFGYSIPVLHEHAAGFIAHVYFASNLKQDNFLKIAEENYMKALALNRMDGNLYVTIAHFYARTGRPAQTEAYLLKVIDIYPHHQTYRLMLARFYAEQKRYAEAIRILEASNQFLKNYAALHPERLDVLSGLATVYQEQGDLERSKEYRAQAHRLAGQVEGPSDKGRKKP